MRTLLSAVAVLGMCCTPIGADCRRVRVNTVVVQQDVITPVFVSTFAVPAYTVGYAGASYAAPGYSAAAAPTDDTNQLLRQILARLEKLEGGAGQAQQAGSHPGVAFLEATCTKCHNADVAQAKGGNKVLFNFGKMIKLSGDDWQTVLAEIDSGRMPKGGPKVSDEQYSNVVAAFVSQAKSPRAQAPPPMPPSK